MIARTDAVAHLQSEHFDVVVIGGGITGAGVALDAAARGYSVALVEKSDYAAGTSSRSSKLVHGGLRYLQNFDLGLVREALLERQLLVALAPHLVRPLQLLVLTVLGEAERFGTVMANGLEVRELVEEGGRAAGVRVRDGEAGEEFVVRADNVVNATGVWADRIRPEELHDEAEVPTIRPSR